MLGGSGCELAYRSQADSLGQGADLCFYLLWLQEVTQHRRLEAHQRLNQERFSALVERK